MFHLVGFIARKPRLPLAVGVLVLAAGIYFIRIVGLSVRFVLSDKVRQLYGICTNASCTRVLCCLKDGKAMHRQWSQ